MANTYTQIDIQVVFSVQGRQSLIQRERKEELYKYISGIVRNKNQKLIAINGMADHVHISLGMKPNIALSDSYGVGLSMLLRSYKPTTPSGVDMSKLRWFFGT